MKKKLFCLITSTILILSMSACAGFGNPTQNYINAFIKTNSADSMEVKNECKITIDTSKASESIKTKLSKFKEISLNLDEAVDNKAQKLKIDTFLSAGDIMLDPKIYAEGEKLYVKYGDKYYDASGMENMDTEKNNSTSEEYKKLYDEFGGIWKNAVANEILSSEGNSIIYTPDGDIKVTQVSLKLTDEKQKNILGELAEVVSKSTILKENAMRQGKNYKAENISDADIEKGVEDWFKNLPLAVDDAKKKYVLDNLSLTAKIDKDSYIIDQTVEGTVTIKHEGEIKISFKMHTTRWNINSGSIKIDIPNIDKKDLIKMKGFEAKYTDQSKNFFKDLFTSK